MQHICKTALRNTRHIAASQRLFSVASPRFSDNGKPEFGDKDPFPLPFQHPLSTDTSPDAILPHPLDGLSETQKRDYVDVERMRARMIYQTRKRGTLETGLLLSTWATPEKIGTMSLDELIELDQLMIVPEWTLYYWATGKQDPPADSRWASSDLLADLRRHTRNPEKATRVMPELFS